MGNASALELAVGVIALVGLLVTLVNLQQYVLDLQDVRRRHVDGYRRRLAYRHLRNELLRVYMLACFLAVAIIAMLTPPATHVENRRAGIIVSVLLVSMELALTYKTLADRLDLRRDRRLAEAEDRAWQRPGHELY